MSFIYGFPAQNQIYTSTVYCRLVNLQCFPHKVQICPSGQSTYFLAILCIPLVEGGVLCRVIQKISIRLMRVSKSKQRCLDSLFCVIFTVICNREKHCGLTNLQYGSVDLILWGKSMNGWQVRCWFGLRVVENAGEALLYLEK